MSLDKSLRSLLLFASLIVVTVIVLIIVSDKNRKTVNSNVSEYTGSQSCRPCHEEFYQLWAPSHHGQAMQPVTSDFIQQKINGYNTGIKVGLSEFSVTSKSDNLVFTEKYADGTLHDFIATQAMGGKYVYYFLTPLDGGKLQVLPLAYDCSDDSWYNNPQSGVRHFEEISDSPLDWKSHLYTFNTSCYGCHVSQLSTNFNIADLSYNSSWREPGINCETCHGPSSDHIRVCVKAGEENVPDDLKIIVTKSYTPDQHNSSCGSCHGKVRIIKPGYEPGKPFYDYFDLIGLEDPDFYPDGRDLGENYTMTGWEMNSCKESSDLHCVTCHTSSGRFRFKGDSVNNACMPCHRQKVENPSLHTFHKNNSSGSRCISCHMPKSSFARMDRSDHSFRPPMPRATILFDSPNACNNCHIDKSPEWADNSIRQTHRKDYQSETVKVATLIEKARKEDWSDLDLILDGLSEGRFNHVFATSFLRLLERCDDPGKWEVIQSLSDSPSPLVRGAVAHALHMATGKKPFNTLLKLAEDSVRVVRIGAAYSLSTFPGDYVTNSNIDLISRVLSEYESSLVSRADDWSAYYNLGNFLANLGKYSEALDAYNISSRIYPGAIMPKVNAGYINSLAGNRAEAEKLFTDALSYEPDNEAALLNLSLLYSESGNRDKAIIYFRRLFNTSEKNAVAAYNLSLLLSKDDPEEALQMAGLASMWEANNSKYRYAYAWMLSNNNMEEKACEMLASLIEYDPGYIESYILLSKIYTKLNRYEKAAEILRKAESVQGLVDDQAEYIRSLLDSLKQN